MEALAQAAQREVLDSYRREFEMLSAGFRELDGKAQGSATVAGAFLAAGLALLARVGSLKTAWATAALTLVVIALICAILLAIQALRIRKVLASPPGDAVSSLLKKIHESPESEFPERLLYFYGDAAELWSSCVKDRRSANERKARLVWLSQICLTIGALFIASIMIGIIWGA